MTIAAGQCIATIESKKTEHNFVTIVQELVSQMGPGWSLKKSITTDKIFGKSTMARKKNGKFSTVRPDGGWLYYNGKPVACFEHKHQHSRQNAVERLFKYMPIVACLKIPFSNMVVNLEGEGFIFDGNKDSVKFMSGSTGVAVDSCLKVGYTVFINEEVENLRKLLSEKLQNIKISCEQEAVVVQ